MPERWRHEVKRLGDLEPSEEVWRRAELGPRLPAGPNLPPRRERIVAGAVAFVVFLAAGGFAWRALRPSDERSVGGDLNPTITVTLRILDMDGVSIPTATLHAHGRTILGKGTTPHWQSENPGEVTPHFTDEDFAPIVNGSLLGAAGDAESVDAELQRPGTFPFQSVASFGQLRDAVALDQPYGRYVLRLTGHWLQGDATFYFPIDLEEQIGTTVGVTRRTASLSFVGKNAPLVTLRYRDGDQTGPRTHYTWCEGSQSCVEGFADYETDPPPVDFLPIPVGTPLSISGDATALVGVFRRDGAGDDGAVDLDDGAIPSTPGRYVLQIDVAFDHGEATFFLGIDATSTESPPVMETDGSAWQLVSVDGEPVPAGAPPITLESSGDRLYGTDGCNTYLAHYEVDGTAIQVGDIASTKMICKVGATMDRARAFLDRLASAVTYAVVADQLTIDASGGWLTFVRVSAS